MERISIYAICDPLTGAIRYIGQAVNPKDRFHGHCYYSAKTNENLGRWISAIMACDMKPILRILGTVPKAEASNVERREIQVAKANGAALFNVAKPSGVHRVAVRYCTQVLCVQTGQIFDSYAAAGRWAGCSGSTIRNRCRDGQKQGKHNFKET